MSSLVPLKYQDLEAALQWSSSGGPYENQAFIARATGEVHLQSANGDIEEELPEDIEDGTVYIAVPHKNELDLGRNLAFEFVEKHAPQVAAQIRASFHQRRAYSKFKDILERAGQLENWYSFEAAAVKRVLETWASENGFNVTN
jgi:sigma54-dependent transcription regulator